MNNYEILIDTNFGQARMVLQAENYETAQAVADQMNQGFITVNEIEE